MQYDPPTEVKIVSVSSPIDRERIVEYVLVVTYEKGDEVRLDGFTSKEEAQRFYSDEYGRH